MRSSLLSLIPQLRSGEGQLPHASWMPDDRLPAAQFSRTSVWRQTSAGEGWHRGCLTLAALLGRFLPSLGPPHKGGSFCAVPFGAGLALCWTGYQFDFARFVGL